MCKLKSMAYISEHANMSLRSANVFNPPAETAPQSLVLPPNFSKLLEQDGLLEPVLKTHWCQLRQAKDEQQSTYSLQCPTVYTDVAVVQLSDAIPSHWMTGY